jgi:hypothetical protein
MKDETPKASIKEDDSNEKKSKAKHNASELFMGLSKSPRKSSVNPKQIITAPVALLRGLSGSKRQEQSIAAVGSPKTPKSPTRQGPRAADHHSQLKRNYTNEVLRGATTSLEESHGKAYNSIRGELMPPILRSLTQKSTALKGHSKLQVSKGIMSEVSYAKSTEALSPVSYTSSQRAMRLGPQPTSTPEEQATYRVKRSASAETEEFLKVDISIRGGTSYLPSKARRIHTPPLPEATTDGNLKGFFFDYNAPRSVYSSAAVSRIGIPRTTKSKSKRANRLPVGDWVDAKLAEIDLGEELDEEESPSNGSEESDPFVFPGALSHMVKKEEEEEFDMNIPEHLPSSPLCPRNPRYWRVLRGQGSQFRGCWMHGVGEYTIIPGMRM